MQTLNRRSGIWILGGAKDGSQEEGRSQDEEARQVQAEAEGPQDP